MIHYRHIPTRTAWCVTLLGAALFSCESQKLKGPASDTKNEQAAGVSEDESKRILYEDFQQKFLGILAKNELMQSALTKEVDHLCKQLTPELYSQILAHAAQGRSEQIIQENWLLGYNQLMATASDKLGAQTAAPLHQLAANPKADSVLRDYASQHYFRAQARLLRGIQSQSDSEATLDHLKRVIEQAAVLVKADDPNAGTMPGASLLGFAALEEQFADHPMALQMLKEQMAALAMPILKDWSAQPTPTRGAALQAAARLRLDAVGEIAWSIATDPNAETMDRLGAIGALKYFPEKVDADFLTASCRRNPRLQKAAGLITSKP